MFAPEREAEQNIDSQRHEDDRIGEECHEDTHQGYDHEDEGMAEG